MYKVVVRAHQLHLRVRAAQVNIVVHLKEGDLSPFSRTHLIDGIAAIQQEASFYTSSQTIIFKAFFNVGDCHKYIGKCAINLFDWNSNTYNQMEIYFSQSPDRFAKIKLDLIYFVPSSVSFFCEEQIKRGALLQQNVQLQNFTKVLQGEQRLLRNQKESLQQGLKDKIMGYRNLIEKEKNATKEITKEVNKNIQYRIKLMSVFNGNHKKTYSHITQMLNKKHQ